MIQKLVLGSVILSAPAFADIRVLKGSDTLGGFMKDAISAIKIDNMISYAGGGSSLGEEALVTGQQGLAPMSRAIKAEALAKAKANGIVVLEHVVGLDGVAVFTHAGNTISNLGLDQLKKIYSCEVTSWKALGGADQAITVYRREDVSGTTDTFKSLIGLKDFGSCVQVVDTAAEAGSVVIEDSSAISFSPLSASMPGNKMLALSKDASTPAYLPTPENIRKSSYPLARKLYVYHAAGSVDLTPAEDLLLSNILDRSFADPLVQKNDFLTVD